MRNIFQCLLSVTISPLSTNHIVSNLRNFAVHVKGHQRRFKIHLKIIFVHNIWSAHLIRQNGQRGIKCRLIHLLFYSTSYSPTANHRVPWCLQVSWVNTVSVLWCTSSWTTNYGNRTSMLVFSIYPMAKRSMVVSIENQNCYSDVASIVFSRYVISPWICECGF